MPTREQLLVILENVEDQAESLRLSVNCFDIDGDDYESFQEEYAKLQSAIFDLKKAIKNISEK